MTKPLHNLLTLAVISLAFTAATGHCSVSAPLELAKRVELADCIFRGTVVAVEPFRSATDGAIYTRTIFRVEELLKGNLPATVELVHFGGALDGFAVQNCALPEFNPGEEYLMFVWRRHDGTLGAVGGDAGAIKLKRCAGPARAGATNALCPAHAELLERTRTLIETGNSSAPDTTNALIGTLENWGPGPLSDGGGQAVTNFLTAPDGKPPRWVTQDRGEPIPCLIDMSLLPAGITTNQALAAVSNALNAWAAVTSLKFVIEGVTNFGMPAELVATNDGRLRIQLYSYTNYIALKYGAGYLGIGGPRYTYGLLENAGWGLGGNVAGNEFHKIVAGFAMINHTNAALSVLPTFTEVLCHEIGHALGLAHSSDPQAIMYPTAHADGRGAQLASTDIAVVRQGYPHLNTPPFMYPRVMDITTAPWPVNVPGINEIELSCYDLQTASQALAITNATSMSGTFSLSAPRTLKYSPAAFYNAPRLDPGGSSYYDRIACRCSDGTNAAPYVWVRVISFNPDQYPWGNPDGIPDAWMTSWFGSPNPAAGPKRGAYDDYDGDGLNNLQEYIAGMDPTNPASCQRIVSIGTNSISWQAKPYELYELEYTTNLVPTFWASAQIQVVPGTETATAQGTAQVPGAAKFFRVRKVP